MNIIPFLVSLCLFVITLSAQAACVPTLTSGADFIEHCGRADPHSREVKQAEAVFKKVRQVAPQRHAYKADLVVTRKPGLLAVAVKDAIVVSLATVRFCYRDVSREDGDTRLAFVLGHELAHQANHDLRNRYSRASPLAEPHADEDGFLYAALAGYPVDRLVAGGEAFFSTWYQRQNHTGNDGHGSPAERAAALQSRLRDLLEELAFFHFGTRLAHFGRYEDARYFLERFQEYFAAPETLNNLGYVHLQLALAAMSNHSEELPYCLPALLDVKSRADLLGDVSGEGLRGVDDTARAFLETAHRYFEDVGRMDPGYMPAQLNLASTEFYLERFATARAIIEDNVEKQLPDNPSTQILKALITLEQGGTVDTWPNALRILQALADKPDAAACEIYNTAVLLSRRERAEAQVYWDKLYRRRDTLPAPLRALVCARTSCPPPATPAVPPGTLPVQPGALLTPMPETMKKWHKRPFNFHGKLRGAIYQAPDGSAEILAFRTDNGTFAEMVVVKAGLNITPEFLAHTCHPALDSSFGDTRVWGCGHWAVVTKSDKITEIWVAGSE